MSIGHSYNHILGLKYPKKGQELQSYMVCYEKKKFHQYFKSNLVETKY